MARWPRSDTELIKKLAEENARDLRRLLYRLERRPGAARPAGQQRADVMEPLEQVTILMTLMHRLEQVMDQERGILRGMRLGVLPDLQDEKEALAEAYEIELNRLRLQPERLAGLKPHVREALEANMRGFQAKLARNVETLRAAQGAVESILHAISDNLQRNLGTSSRETSGEPAGAASGARIIPMALDGPR